MHLYMQENEYVTAEVVELLHKLAPEAFTMAVRQEIFRGNGFDGSGISEFFEEFPFNQLSVVTHARARTHTHTHTQAHKHTARVLLWFSPTFENSRHVGQNAHVFKRSQP